MLDKTSSIICAFSLASAAPRSPYRHLELCGIALENGGCNGNRRDFAVEYCHGGGPDGTFCAAGAVCPTGLPQNCGQID
ncbi:MAG: hypothetical protein ACLT8A_14240 [Subdoligranulum sp.]